jgi:predicted nucleic acid-binding protein
MNFLAAAHTSARHSLLHPQATAERAKEIVMGHRLMPARDAVHLAIMGQHGIKRILSFDSGFDSFSGITRLS